MTTPPASPSHNNNTPCEDRFRQLHGTSRAQHSLERLQHLLGDLGCNVSWDTLLWHLVGLHGFQPTTNRTNAWQQRQQQQQEQW